MTAPPVNVTAVLAAYGLKRANAEPIHHGNINVTYRVDHGAGRYVLQRLNPIFAPEVHLDIEAVTDHLARSGMLTPRLVHARNGALWVSDERGGVWRLMTYIDGLVLHQADSSQRCREAGRILGRFHRILSRFEHTFHAARPGVHDTARHLAHLREVLSSRRDHPAYAAVAPVAEQILQLATKLEPLPTWPRRIVHGDPKLNNIVFSPQGEALCLIDLDTLSHMTLAVELGDALRSWCNPGGEEASQARFEVDFFAAALTGYRQEVSGLLTAEERQVIPAAVETIALELAARFGADALEESYFAWDRGRYQAAWQHHLVRAQSQLALACSIASQRAETERVVKEIFTRNRSGR